jgi:dTDP-4-amino-4,6-dideoxygalactose transaminase
MRGDDVILPALTFSATGLAVIKRHVPFLQDVDVDMWQLETPEHADSAAAYMPVAAFGRPVELDPWESLAAPVVIDAAGSLFMQRCSQDENILTCFSMHATKFIGAGEGGFVACADQHTVNEIQHLAMFGHEGTNAKMSEYHAAVALAALGRVEQKHYRTETVRRWYKEHGIEELKHYSNGYGSMLTVELKEPCSVVRRMSDHGIEVHQWYRPWLDERPDFDQIALPVTGYLRERLVGLPFHNFLTEADVAHVMASLFEVIR